MKTLSSIVSMLLACSLSAVAGVDLGNSAGGTPYDSYMQPVRQVLKTVEGVKPSMERVQSLMRQGRNFRYAFSWQNPYEATSPEVTASTRCGDCKAKSLWLIDQLGDRDVRFVVGKAHYGAKLSHAWVLWKGGDSRWYVLDCTNNYRPIAADTLRRDEYIPLYSWSRGGTYQHAATQIGLAAVAGKKSPVATADRS